MPTILLIISIFISLGSILAIYQIWKQADIYFIKGISTLSLSTITLLNFQFFGVFMVLGLSYSPQYFQYLTISGISCFLSSVATNKLSFFIFMAQNSDHPLIDQNGLRSPRVRFYLSLVFSEILFFILSFVFVRYSYFSWYILGFYSYPLVHILKVIITGNRNNFRW